MEEKTQQILLDNHVPIGVQCRIESFNPKNLKLLERNARFMRHEVFQRLVANVARDGALTSVPFACLDEDGRYLVLSGNHRVMAAIEAGLQSIHVMVTDDPLTNEQRIAIQLSHNELAGEDDPSILKGLYQDIQDVDWKLYAGLDDKTLDLLEKIDIGSLAEANLQFYTLTFAFLPHEIDRVKESFAEAQKVISGTTFLVDRMEYSRFLDAMDLSSRSFGIHNQATALLIVLEIFERHITDLSEGWLDEEGDTMLKSWVPLASIIGTDSIPVSAAAVIKQAVDKMVTKDDVSGKSRWQALEYWAADYLGS